MWWSVDGPWKDGVISLNYNHVMDIWWLKVNSNLGRSTLPVWVNGQHLETTEECPLARVPTSLHGSPQTRRFARTEVFSTQKNINADAWPWTVIYLLLTMLSKPPNWDRCCRYLVLRTIYSSPPPQKKTFRLSLLCPFHPISVFFYFWLNMVGRRLKGRSCYGNEAGNKSWTRGCGVETERERGRAVWINTQRRGEKVSSLWINKTHSGGEGPRDGEVVESCTAPPAIINNKR